MHSKTFFRGSVFVAIYILSSILLAECNENTLSCDIPQQSDSIPEIEKSGKDCFEEIPCKEEERNRVDAGECGRGWNRVRMAAKWGYREAAHAAVEEGEVWRVRYDDLPPRVQRRDVFAREIAR
tara:strand:+ start:1728 stop:2099 length:372 start_codon:yes stop_codon:yes gene_type:complete